jgi:hypothetical protein
VTTFIVRALIVPRAGSFRVVWDYNLGVGTYHVDTESQPGIVRFKLEGTLTAAEARAFVTAHNNAIDRLRNTDYVVFGDLRALRPLSPDCAEIIEQAKRYSAGRRNFRGSAILVENQVVALQHRRTSTTGGVISTELISASEEECRNHLAALRQG